jgi:hypothetical protein
MIINQILMTETRTTKNEAIPNGQLMHLALEVASKAIELQQNKDNNKDTALDITDASLPPVCAL